MENHYPEILRRYMGEERVGGSTYYDSKTKNAADICGASNADKVTEPVRREERAQYS